MSFVKFSFLFLLTIFFYSLFPTYLLAQTSLPGDANGDLKVDGSDFVIWLSHYGKINVPGNQADFNRDGRIDGVDFTIWFANYGKNITPTVTNTPTTTVTPVSSGIWISKEEIMRLPTTGAAWNKVVSAAQSSWGSACLDDLNCLHDTNTLAGALVAVRLNDTVMRNKTITGIQSAMTSPLDRTLELARNLQSYVIAADIIGYRSPEFESFLRAKMDQTLPGRASIPTVWQGSLKDSTNWGNHQRAAAIATYLYLKDTNRLSQVTNAYKEWIGLPVTTKTMTYDATNWIADQNNKAGVNRYGSTISTSSGQKIHVSGVLPEDWRRGCEFKWLPCTSGYMLEGMQGYVVAAVMLHRAGLVPFNASDDSVVRAMNMLHGRGEASLNSPVLLYPPTGDDTWMTWVVNYYGNTSYPAVLANPGKNMGWTDWTHPNN